MRFFEENSNLSNNLKNKETLNIRYHLETDSNRRDTKLSVDVSHVIYTVSYNRFQTHHCEGHQHLIDQKIQRLPLCKIVMLFHPLNIVFYLSYF